MDLLFVFIMLGLLLYSGIAILYFVVKLFLPSNTQKRNTSSQRVSSNRKQERNLNREFPTSQNRNANKQAPKSAWKSLTSEIKDIMNEMDGESTKKTSSTKRNAPQVDKRAVSTPRTGQRSFEGGGSTEGTYVRTGRGSLEGVGSTEGTASYEGTEFHPRGHSTRQRPAKKAVSAPKKRTAEKTVSASNLKKNLVNAVIYKEILDQPRSKRPIR